MNYEYGVLEHPARTAIHVTHRIGAAHVPFLGWLVLAVLGRRTPGGAALLVGACCCCRSGWESAMSCCTLPDWCATAHNGVAALLLVSSST